MSALKVTASLTDADGEHIRPQMAVVQHLLPSPCAADRSRMRRHFRHLHAEGGRHLHDYDNCRNPGASGAYADGEGVMKKMRGERDRRQAHAGGGHKEQGAGVPSTRTKTTDGVQNDSTVHQEGGGEHRGAGRATEVDGRDDANDPSSRATTWVVQ